MAEIANGTDEGPPDEGSLWPLGDKPASWTEWEADWWMSPEPFDGTAMRALAQPFPLHEERQWEHDYHDHA
ncbi:hypothetical protein AB0478_45720 [Streptomyces sp. NPDC051917]|uniref:hypothetical protein n=1 Tax=Streptomyces sp. NPDC051917 TaxID=3154754 RepID=UPI003454EA6F